MSQINTVVFDLGGVLVNWDPRAVFRPALPDEAALETFLTETNFWERNLDNDTRSDWAHHVAEVRQIHSEHADLFAEYSDRFTDSMCGDIPGSIEIVSELRQSGLRLLALTNWAADNFSKSVALMPWLDWFDGVVVSGREGVAKPKPEIYQVLVNRLGVVPNQTVFIDDRSENVEGAVTLGFHGIVFTNALALRSALVELHTLPS